MISISPPCPACNGGSAHDSRLAQNPDGTGAVANNGDPVGFISDLSGNGHNAVMGNSILSGGDSLRPTLTTDPVGLPSGIFYSGLTTSSIGGLNLNGSSSMTLALVLQGDNSDLSGRYLFGGSGVVIAASNTAVPFASAGFGDGSHFVFPSKNLFGGQDIDVFMVRVQSNSAGGRSDFWENGVSMGSTLWNTAGAPIRQTTPWLLGNANFASAAGAVSPSGGGSKLSFLEGLATNTALSDTQISQLYSTLSVKWPGVQQRALSPNLYWGAQPWNTANPAPTFNAGHIEGIASGDGYRYKFDTALIEKYDTNWNLITANESINAGTPLPKVHSGDGDYLAGKVFAPLEADFGGGAQGIAVYDATKPGLPLITYKDISAQHHEFSALTVVPNAGPHGVMFATAYFANVGGRQLWMYNYADGNVLAPDFGSYLGSLTLPSSVTNVQGVAWQRRTSISAPFPCNACCT